jgi:hypothetical protein
MKVYVNGQIYTYMSIAALFIIVENCKQLICKWIKQMCPIQIILYSIVKEWTTDFDNMNQSSKEHTELKKTDKRLHFIWFNVHIILEKTML